MVVWVINGPNLNLLGSREPALYGNHDYAALCRAIDGEAARLNIAVKCFQSNHEGTLVDRIQAARGVADALIINAAAYTHTSIALLDAVKAVELPAVEVHLTDIDSREPFRRLSYVGMACRHRIVGKGFEGYLEALRWLAGQ